MAASPAEIQIPANNESHTARKKKGKVELASETSGTHSPAVPDDPSKETLAAGETENDHPYIRELHKQIRNINKKLAGMTKVESIVAEHATLSLDDLVAQRKINVDQRAAVLKKPQLQGQLSQLEEQLEHYRKFDLEYQGKLQKQKVDFETQRLKDIAQLREDVRLEAMAAGASELREKLLLFSQFLRAAAAKRSAEEDTDTDESRAFEGALLLVYGGDNLAVDTAVRLIEGSSDPVSSIEGLPLPVTYAQIRQASIDHTPFRMEEAWVDQVVQATGGDGLGPVSDPTVTHAGLTEIDPTGQVNGVTQDLVAHELDPSAAKLQMEATGGNVAGERWDTDGGRTGGAGTALEDSFEIIPRPSDEVDIASTTLVPSEHPTTSWADETALYNEATGNQAGENWDRKAAGDTADSSVVTLPSYTNGSTTVADDGFHEVAGRHRGRGGGVRGRGADGEYRGRGGRRGNFRGRGGGDGEFRGRGGGDGEFRGRGSGFRGGRGNGEFRGRGRGRGGIRGSGADVTPGS